MKSFFTKLGTLLLCGVAVAVVGCTDFAEDIQANKSEFESSIADLASKTDVKVKDLQDAINALSAQVAADRTTLQELQNVHNTFATSVQGQIDGLTANFNKVNNDLNAAQTAINAQIAALQQADATNKAALESAIAAAKAEATAAITQLQSALEAQKTGLEAEIANVKKQIADTKAELEAVIDEKAGKEYVDEELGKVNAKADELFNTIQSLSEYLGTLEAQISELNNTLISLGQYLPTVEAKIADNTAKVSELKNELVSLSEYLSEREALVNAQLKELQNTLLSLGVYMESLEASIDARFAEILNTIESLAIHLVEVEAQVALNTESAAAANAKAEELYNTLLSLSYEYNEEKASNAAKFAEVLATFESLSQHLAQVEAEHEAGIADNSAKIAELKSELVSLSQYLEEANYDGKFQEIQNTLLALSDHLAAEEAANLAKFAEVLATFESLSQHLAEEEASNDAKFVELFNTLQSLSPVIDNLDAKILEVKNTVESLGLVVEGNEAKILELQSTLLSLSMFLEEADLIVRVSALEDDLAAHLAAYEVFQTATVEDLATLFARTEQLFGQLEALSPEVTTIKAQIAEIKSELLSLAEHLADRETQVDGKLAELFATFESLSPVIATMQAQILENNSALQSLAPVIATMQAQIAENFATLQSLSPKIEELEAKDAELDTKIAEVRNQLVSLEPVIATMQAQINENRGTLESLSEYLPELKAELEDKISAVDAKANELNGQLTALSQQLPVMFAEVNASIKAVADRVSKIEVDVEGLKATLAALQEALDAAKKELGDKDAEMSQTIAGLKDLCKDQQDLIGANIDNIYKNAQDIADIYLQVAALAQRMDDADDFSAQLNNTIQQLSAQMWEMFGLVDTQLGAITEAYTGADAEIRAELAAGLAEVLELAFKNDEGVMHNVRQFELKVNAIVEELRAQINKIEVDVDGLKATLAALQEALDAAKKELGDKDAEMSQTITGLKALCKDQQDLIGANIDNIYKNAQDIADIYLQVAALAQRMDDADDFSAQLNNTIQQLSAQMWETFGLVDTKLGEITDAYTAADTEIRAELEAGLAEILELAFKNDEGVMHNVHVFELKVNAIVEELRAQINKIEVDVDGLKATLAALQTALDAAKKELGDKDAVMSQTITGLKNLCKDQQDLIGANIDNIYKNTQDIADIYLKVAALVQRMDDADDFSAQLNNTIKQLSAQMWETFGLVDTKLGEITEAYTAADAEIRAELEAGLADILLQALENDSAVMDNVHVFEMKISALLEDLRVDVDKLLNRIQSVVYVPTHSDAKARVEYAVVGTRNPQIVQSSKNTIEYQVYPKSAAKEIADAYNNGDENFAISFLSKDVVLTRSANEYITVVAVNGDPETGILTVNYRTNFDVNFFPVGYQYNVTKSYSAALVIENTANDEKFSTEYTNFVAGDRVNYSLGLQYTDGSSYRGKLEEYEIEYTDKKVYPVLDQIVPVFYNNQESLTASQFEETYGAAPVVDVEMYAFPPQTKTFVTTFDETVPSVTVQLGENVNLNNVGEKLYVTLAYSAGGDRVEAKANVEVVGVKVNYAVENELTATWEYLKDASSDVNHNTHRTFEVAVADITVDNVLANTSLKDILSSYMKDIKITSNDVDVKDETIALSANAEKMTVEFDNFKWNATYNVVATYYLKYAKVTVKFTIVTVDRVRKPIDIELGTTTLNYVKDLAVAPNTYKYDLAPVVEKLVELGNLDANYADDIFVKHMVEVNNYSKYAADVLLSSGNEATENDIVFDFQNQKFTFSYDSNKLDKVYNGLAYYATFTTWYGQVVTIKHNLAFTFPVYDFVHTTYYVKNDNGNYYSQVMGVYEDGTVEKPVNTTKLQSFTTDNVNLNKAFSVVDAKGAIVENLAALGLVTEFEIESAHGAGIVINNNIISYNDTDDYVDVIGRIYLQNANGTRVELPTSFATTYAGYTVKKYDPIGELKAYNFQQKIENKIKYNIPVLKHFTLKDSRNFVEMYDLIDANGNWVDGDGNNGFAKGENPCTVYGLSTDYAQVVIPSGFEDIISFKDGILTFDNTNNMAIVEDIVIDITFIINYTWGSREATVQCTFPKNI